MKWWYEGFNVGGQVSSGEFEAESMEEASEYLRAKGIYPQQVKQVGVDEIKPVLPQDQKRTFDEELGLVNPKKQDEKPPEKQKSVVEEEDEKVFKTLREAAQKKPVNDFQKTLDEIQAKKADYQAGLITEAQAQEFYEKLFKTLAPDVLQQVVEQMEKTNKAISLEETTQVAPILPSEEKTAKRECACHFPQKGLCSAEHPDLPTPEKRMDPADTFRRKLGFLEEGGQILIDYLISRTDPEFKADISEKVNTIMQKNLKELLRDYVEDRNDNWWIDHGPCSD